MINENYLIKGNIALKRDGSRRFEANVDILKYYNDPEFKEILVSNGVINENESANYDIQDLVIKQNSIYNNKRLFIQTTNKCNLKCKHCYLESSPNEKDELTYEDVIDIIDEAIELGIWRVDFTGGEVFFKKYFFDVLEYIKFKPISSCIFTNLTLIDDHQIDVLVDNPAIRKIITSIDYFDEKKHDRFRGKSNSFSKTMNTLIELNTRGKKVIVNTMVLNDNHDDILEMIDFFIPKGIEMHFETVINSGRAKSYQEKLLDQEKLNIDFINSCTERIKGLKRYKYKQVDALSCGVGETLIFVNNHKRFQVCSGINEKYGNQYYLGDNIQEAYVNLKKINLKCNMTECRDYLDCSYGCKMRSLLHHGSVNHPDDVICYYNKIKD